MISQTIPDVTSLDIRNSIKYKIIKRTNNILAQFSFKSFTIYWYAEKYYINGQILAEIVPRVNLNMISHTCYTFVNRVRMCRKM